MPIPFETSEDREEIVRRVRKDEQRINRFLEVREYLIEQLKSTYYDLEGDQEFTWTQGKPDNFVLSYMTNLAPDTAFQSPRVKVTSMKSGAAKQASKAVNHMTNRMLIEMDYTRLARRSGADYTVGYSVLWRGIGPKPGLSPDDDPVDRPFSDRISPSLFGFDTSADTWEEREYAWHDTIEYLDDLKELAKENEGGGWLLDEIENAPEGVAGELRRGGKVEGKDMKGKVIYRTMHLPKADPTDLVPDGEDHRHYHGVLLTFMVTSGGPHPGMVQIREPRAYYGATDGPYEMIGMQYIPDESLESSVLVLVLAQQIEYADILEANNQSARDYKRFMVTNSKKLAQIIQKAKHHKVFFKADLDKDNVQTHEYGGLGPLQDYMEQRSERNFQKNLGMTQRERGELTGDTTATADAIAHAESTARRAQTVVTFHEGHERNIRALAEMAYISDSVAVDLGPTAEEDFGPNAVFFGGTKPSPTRVRKYYEKNYPDFPLEDLDVEQLIGPDIPWTDLELRVEMGSMGRKTDQQRLMEVQADMQILGMMIQMIMQSPLVTPWELKKRVSEKLNDPELMDVLDDHIAAMFQAAMIEQMGAQQQQGGQQGGGGGGPKAPQPQMLSEGVGRGQPQHSSPAGRSGESATATKAEVGVGL